MHDRLKGSTARLAVRTEEPQPARIPFAVPHIGNEEIAEAVEALRSGWITSGPRTAQFDQQFCEYTGAVHALAVNSCTVGLHLALAALGIGPGDEVITTPLTFCATVNVIIETGATAVLADTGPDLNIDPSAAARLITPRDRGGSGYRGAEFGAADRGVRRAGGCECR